MTPPTQSIPCFMARYSNRPLCLERKSFDRIVSNQQSFFPMSEDFGMPEPYTVGGNLAVIPIHGALSKRSGLFDAILGFTSYDTIHDQLNTALADDSIKTILLDVDSPGGEVNGLFDLSDRIYQARNIKSIYAIANEESYSAAYAISSAAEKIFISRTSGVGSIGVIANHMDQSAYDEKLGVKFTPIFAGSHKNDLSPHQALSEDAAQGLQEEINRIYDVLIETIARNRNISPQAVRQTEAGLFFGADAIKAGLADEMSTMPQLITTIQSTLKPKLEYHTMTEPQPTEATQSPPDINALVKAAEAKGRENYRSHILDIAKSCKLSNMSDKLVSFIEQDVTLDAAKDTLMEALASNQKQTEIQSHVTPLTYQDQESPVVAEAKKRMQGGA